MPFSRSRSQRVLRHVITMHRNHPQRSPTTRAANPQAQICACRSLLLSTQQEPIERVSMRTHQTPLNTAPSLDAEDPIELIRWEPRTRPVRLCDGRAQRRTRT